MTNAVQQPPPAAPAAEPPRRPVTVGIAAALLAALGVGGLAYAVATLAVTPTVVDHFRGAVAAGSNVDGLITVLWVAAAIGSVLAVILFALYVVLALGLRRGSNASRIGVWVLCVLGVLAGGASTLTLLVQQSGEPVPGSVGQALVDAYPDGWIGLNLALSIAQIIGYVVIAVLLIVTPGVFFGRAAAPAVPTYAGIPGYGSTSPQYAPGAPPTSGASPLWGTPGVSPSAGVAPGSGAPGYPPAAAPGAFGPPPGYGPPGNSAAYGPPPGTGPAPYGPPPGNGSAAYGPPPGYAAPPPGHAAGPGYSPTPDRTPSWLHGQWGSDPDADFWRRPEPPATSAPPATPAAPRPPNPSAAPAPSDASAAPAQPAGENDGKEPGPR